MKFIRLVLSLVLLAAAFPALATITPTTNRVGPYTCTSLPATLSVTFPYQASSDLLVLDLGQSGTSNDPPVVLTLNSDYTVTGGGYNSSTVMQSGNVVVVGTGAHSVQTNDQIVILRNVPVNQTTSLVSGILTAATIEKALDKTATISQQLTETTGRALRFEAGETLDGVLERSARAGKLLGFDNTTGAPVFVPTASIVATADANTVYAGPTSGAAAAPTFRALADVDMPVVSVAHGGTGLTTFASGKILYASALDTYAPLNVGNSLAITAGTLDTAQDLRTTASPTFGGLAVTGALSSTAASNIFTLTNSTSGSATDRIKFGFTTNEYAFINYDDTNGYLSMGTPSGRSYAVTHVINGSVITTTSSTGLAVTGDLSCTGALSKGSGTFKIDHPLASLKDTRYLVHSFIEGPRADLIYRGSVTLANGKATVDIDASVGMTEGTFVALATNPQVWLQNESGWTPVKGSVAGNVLTVTAKDPVAETVSWLVIAERHDPNIRAASWTDANGKPILEPEKSVDLAESKKQGKRVLKKVDPPRIPPIKG